MTKGKIRTPYSEEQLEWIEVRNVQNAVSFYFLELCRIEKGIPFTRLSEIMSSTESMRLQKLGILKRQRTGNGLNSYSVTDVAVTLMGSLKTFDPEIAQHFKSSS